jgi:signal transduction histidine kinase
LFTGIYACHKKILYPPLINRNDNIKCKVAILKLSALFIISIFSHLDLISQDNDQQPPESDKLFTTRITSITVNGDTLSLPDYLMGEEILISSTDTLGVEYTLDQVEGTTPPPDINFLFKVLLGNGSGDESRKSVNVSYVSYINLPQEDYLFEVSAFDIRKEWVTSPATLQISVDDSEARLRDSLQNLNDKLDSRIAEAKEISGITDPRNIAPFIAGIIIAALISTLLYILSSLRGKSNKKDTKLKTIDIYSSEPFLALQRERDRLKQELDSLREQISGMEFRSQEIRSKNRELEDKVGKLTEYKDNLEQLQEQKDELFAVIIHDIKNPVGIIKNLVELLRSFDLTATEQQEIMDDIVKTTQTIVSLSHEVSRVLALEGGRMNMNYTVQKISPLIQEVSDRNSRKAQKKDIVVDTEIGDLPEFSFDFMKIYEVIDNLVSNAIKFTQNGGAVRIRTRIQDDKAVLEISDNGLGLSEEDLKKAFKKGSQLSARPTAGESSTGLGLWIVKKLVEAHDGRVSVKSTLGQGSVFSVFLPLQPKSQDNIIEM